LTSVSYSSKPDKNHRLVYDKDKRTPFSLVGIFDRNGKRIATWTYDQFGRATSSQLADGANLTTLSYDKDADGNPVTTVTDAQGEKAVYKFEILQKDQKIVEIDRLAAATRPAATRRFTYDSNGYLVRMGRL
jgi:YD repeat-containing protein